MKDPLRNIEEFVKQRLAFLDTSPVADWELFERKLKRALFFRQLKIYTSFTAVTLLFLFIHKSILLGPDLPSNWWAQDTQKATPAFLAKPAAARPSPLKFGSSQPLNSKALADASTTLKNPVKGKVKAHTSIPLKIKSSKAPRTKVASIKIVSPTKRGILLPRQTATQVAPLANRAGLHLTHSQAQSQPQELNLGQDFMASRSPDYVTKVRQSPPKRAYVSPLQSKNPWSYAVNVYPNFTFRRFKVNPDKQHLLHSDFVDEMQDNESQGFSLNIGLEVSRRFATAMYFNTGLEYITNTYYANFNFSKFRESNVDPLSGEILNYSLRSKPEQVAFNDNNQFRYLNLPFSLSYQPWANKHLRLNLEAGASLLYFLNATGTTLDYSTLEVIDLSGGSFRKLMGSLSMKIGLQYWVNPKINIGFEPTFMYFTNTIYTNNHPFDVIPYSVGMNLNLQIKLN